MSFEGHYEDYVPGAVHRHWPGRTIAEYDNTLFALLSMNQNPLFLDDAYAKSQPLGRRPVIDTLAFRPDRGNERGGHDGQSHRQSGIRQRDIRAAAIPRRFSVCGIGGSREARICQQA